MASKVIAEISSSLQKANTINKEKYPSIVNVMGHGFSDIVCDNKNTPQSNS
jgi:hypothetical protein